MRQPGSQLELHAWRVDFDWGQRLAPARARRTGSAAAFIAPRQPFADQDRADVATFGRQQPTPPSVIASPRALGARPARAGHALQPQPACRHSRDLLMLGIAYRIQEIDHGGLGKATRRKLRTLAKTLRATGRVVPTPSLNLKPGARLVREWRGRTHTVTVTEDGFEYAGTSYPSLTTIAKKITGAHWSGPRFFGLLAAVNEHPSGGRNG